MNEEHEGHAELMQLGDFAEDAGKLSPEVFGQRHGEAFLLHHGPLHKLNVQPGLGGTLANEGENTRPGVPFNPGADFLVFPVRRVRPATPEDDLTWVGRSEDNDVVIPDASVSAVHAMLKRGGSGEYLLQDMGSMNGTFVNDDPVPAQGMGAATRIDSGARIRLGSVDLTFLEAPEFLSLVTRLMA
jgi:hypothetical protein